LGDGSEFTGNYIDQYDEETIVEFFKFKIESLQKAKPDLFAFETFPSLKEVKIVVKIIQQFFPDIKAWISFSCKDEKHTNYGESFEDCAKFLSGVDQIIAIGVNCTPPQYCPSLMKIAKEHCKKDLMCYPNSGEIYCAKDNSWEGKSQLTVEYFKELKEIGVKFLGGCCRTNYKTIKLLKDLK
jgi:homocysteine S-methyltransferase